MYKLLWIDSQTMTRSAPIVCEMGVKLAAAKKKLALIMRQNALSASSRWIPALYKTS